MHKISVNSPKTYFGRFLDFFGPPDPMGLFKLGFISYFFIGHFSYYKTISLHAKNSLS